MTGLSGNNIGKSSVLDDYQIRFWYIAY